MDVILLHRVDRDYTVLPNKVMRDRRLSWGARGLLVYLLHLPANFKLNLTYLAKQSPDKRHATCTRIKELQDLGYVVIERARNRAGCYTHTVWRVTDTPTGMPQSGNPVDYPTVDYPTVDCPTVDCPPTEKPTPGNHPLINTTNQQRLNRTTTTASQSVRRDAVVVDDQFEVLDFPPVFSGELRDSALQIIECCPEEHRQNVLYEVAGIIERGLLRGSPIGLLQGVARKAREGAFVPSHGISYAAKQRQEREARARVDAEAALRKQSDPVKSREAARNALATIRKRMGGKAK